MLDYTYMTRTQILYKFSTPDNRFISAIQIFVFVQGSHFISNTSPTCDLIKIFTNSFTYITVPP